MSDPFLFHQQVGKIVLGECDHLRDEACHVPVELTVPVGEAKYVLLCRKCAAGLELGILEKWAGVNRGQLLPALTAIIPDPETKRLLEERIRSYK